MDGRAQFRKAAREISVAAIPAIAILILVARGTVAAVEFAYLGLAASALWWLATAPPSRFSHGRRPRPGVFVPLLGLALVSALSLALFPEPIVLLALVLIVLALIVGVIRSSRATG